MKIPENKGLIRLHYLKTSELRGGQVALKTSVALDYDPAFPSAS